MKYAGPLTAAAPLGGDHGTADFVSYSSYEYDRANTEGDAPSNPRFGQLYDRVTDPLGLRTDTYKDGLGRVTRTETRDATGENGNLTGFAQTLYGAAGQPVPGVALPAGFPAAFDGQHVVKLAPGPTLGGDPVATYYLYDGRGRLTDVWPPAVTDGDAASATYGQNVRPHWQYGYDADGNQTSQTDPRGNTTTFAYDERNLRTGRRLPDVAGQPVSDELWQYDDLGRVALHEDFDGDQTTYAYETDARYGGRATGEDRYAGAADGTPDERTVYHYDGLSRQDVVTEYADGNLADPSRVETTTFDPVTGGVASVAPPRGRSTTGTRRPPAASPRPGPTRTTPPICTTAWASSRRSGWTSSTAKPCRRRGPRRSRPAANLDRGQRDGGGGRRPDPRVHVRPRAGRVAGHGDGGGRRPPAVRPGLRLPG